MRIERIDMRIVKKIFIIPALALFVYAICVLQLLSGIEFLISENTETTFVVENDIILNWKFYKKEYGDVETFDVRYCKYWSGMMTHILEPKLMFEGNEGKNCPIVIFRSGSPHRYTVII